MTVIVENLQGGGGSPPVTLFTDSLLAPDQPFLTGNDWYTCQVANGGNTGTMDQLAVQLDRTATGLRFLGSGAGSRIFQTVMIPAPLNYQAVWGKFQFSEFKFISDTSAGANCNTVGACVWAQPNGLNGYCALLNKSAVANGSVTLREGSVGTGAIISPDRAIVANDVIRIVVRRGVGTNTVTMLINGVITDTVSNNNEGQAGMPGLCCDALFAGAQTTVFSTYRGGAGFRQ